MDSTEDIRQQLVEQFSRSVAATREQLYWRMIASGQLPSEGWRIAEKFTTEGAVMHYECWPITPRIIT